MGGEVLRRDIKEKLRKIEQIMGEWNESTNDKRV